MRTPLTAGPSPGGREDKELTAWYTALGRARRELAPLRRGDLRWLQAQGRVLAFSRTLGGETVAAAVNSGDSMQVLRLERPSRDVLSGEVFGGAVPLPPMCGRLLVLEK